MFGGSDRLQTEEAHATSAMSLFRLLLCLLTLLPPTTTLSLPPPLRSYLGAVAGQDILKDRLFHGTLVGEAA